MSTQVTLRNLAIKNAKDGDWNEAVKNNLEIIALDPENTNALNRLGLAYIQLGKTTKAKKSFKQTLEIDPTNKIATKHLQKIKDNQAVAAPCFAKQHFIEEVGKTKVVELLRLAGKEVLEAIPVGEACSLRIKNRYISIIGKDGQYLGSLPEDLSFRLSKLIKGGNTYSCQIRSCSTKECKVYLKELTQSAKNRGTHSFPSGDIALHPLSTIDESVALEEDIPFQIVETDSDVEKTLEDVNTQDVLKN